MFYYLLVAHSYVRWIVLFLMLITIYKFAVGLIKKQAFTENDNRLRHFTATAAHIQLVFGIALFTQSPIAKYFWTHTAQSLQSLETAFFGSIHTILMLISIILVTVGSSLAKRKEGSATKFRTVLICYSIALLIIFIAIPWPFSPLVQRPYFR